MYGTKEPEDAHIYIYIYWCTLCRGVLDIGVHTLFRGVLDIDVHHVEVY
jgi:hypothetical protein